MKKFIFLTLLIILLSCVFAEDIDFRMISIESDLNQAKANFLDGHCRSGFYWLKLCRESLPQDSTFICTYIDYWQAYGYYLQGNLPQANQSIQKGFTCWEHFRLPGYLYNLDLLILQYQIAASMNQPTRCDSIYQAIRQLGSFSKDASGSFYFKYQPLFQLVRICHQQGDNDKALYFIQTSMMKLQPTVTMDSMRFPHTPGYYLFLHETAWAYLCYVRNDLPEARRHLQLAAKYESQIGELDEKEYLQQTFSFIAVLIHYDSKQYRSCKKEMKTSYGVRYRRLSELPYDLYHSPLTPEDWDKLLRIEKQLPVYKVKNPFSS